MKLSFEGKRVRDLPQVIYLRHVMKVFIPQSGLVFLSSLKKITGVIEMILTIVLKDVFEKDSDFSRIKIWNLGEMRNEKS